MSRLAPAIVALFVFLPHTAVLAQVATPSLPVRQTVSIAENYLGTQLELKAWLRIPASPSPLGTVILLHGCNGIDRAGWRHLEDWAAWLNEIGYAALFVDSFSPRNVTNVCQDGGIVPGEQQAADLYAAADYISRTPQLRGKKIGAIGFSHGGWGILEANAKIKPGIRDLRTRLQANNVDVSAFVAMYPACFRHVQASFYAPMLVLIGESDDWTLAESCEKLMAFPRATTEPELRVKAYPNATHSFDVDRPERTYFGHVLRYDAAAAGDARQEIETFFTRWLR
jgi:dienelactone hydrolase